MVERSSSEPAMRWFGKAMGGVIGLVTGGPPGAVLGVLLGHRLDQTDGGALFGRRVARDATRRVSQLFFEVAFEIMGRVAKIDGRVSEDEVRVARALMHGMGLTPEQVQSAIGHFTRGKAADYPLAERLEQLAREIADRAELARAFMQLQLQAAIGAGQIGPAKRQLLWYVASTLRVSRAQLAQIESLVRTHAQRAARQAEAQSIEDAYRVLGLAKTASDDEIKKAYRRLMNRHHPDKLVARGLPASMAGIAEQKTLEVRSAYEKLKAARGLK